MIISPHCENFIHWLIITDEGNVALHFADRNDISHDEISSWLCIDRSRHSKGCQNNHELEQGNSYKKQFRRANI
jgi:hypothetical protein